MNAPVRRALVLAAGMGTRIGVEVPDLPKPLIELGGRSILERNLVRLAAAGVQVAWINLHHRGEAIESRIRDGRGYGLEARYSREATLLGTAGAAKRLTPELSGQAFYVVYSDNLTSVDLRAMARQHRARGSIVTIAAFDPELTANSGIAGGRVDATAGRGIVSFREGGGGRFVNAGVYLLDPMVLEAIPAAIPADFGRDVFPALLAAGRRLDVFVFSGFCLAVDTPAALARARDIFQADAAVASGLA